MSAGDCRRPGVCQRESRLVAEQVAEQAADRIRAKVGDRAIGPAAVFRRAS
ncbi:hypothetical protein AB0G49_24285 [Streptomyces longwoodensis]|uniref:hypothetical protein n=1 Tax=Streptomyces longwoodensis TaxID=68231 RepID=UPI003403F116